eukprot:6982321-Lingulodinium_polyedra.AAC.1
MSSTDNEGCDAGDREAAAPQCRRLRWCAHGGMPSSVAHAGRVSARAKTARDGGNRGQRPRRTGEGVAQA